MDSVFIDPSIGRNPYFIPPRIPASNKRLVKHVVCENARWHVLGYNASGTHCSEPDCIVNAGRCHDRD